MNTKPFFLPSEVARLVLGYLISQGFDQTSRRFLIECDCLAEFRKLKSMGLEYPTNILGLSLIEILDNFGFMKTQALERYNLVASTDTLWREMDSCIEKLKYRMFQSNSHKVTIPKIRTQRKFPDRNVKVLPENIGEMLLKQGKIMSSKQLAQTLKKVHETNKTGQNGPLKENHIENGSTDIHPEQNVNLNKQDLWRDPSIPGKQLPDGVKDEAFVEEIEEPTPSLEESIEKDQNRRNVIHNNNNNNNSGSGKIAPADKPNAPHNTESISSQAPSCYTPVIADNLPTATTSGTSSKQSDSGNPPSCLPIPNRQLSSSSGLTQTTNVEPEVTAIPQLGVSVLLTSKVSESGCKLQTTKSWPIYQSVGTQSELSFVTSPSQPIMPCVTTALETIPSTNTEVQVASPSKSLSLIPESTSNTELLPNANTLSSPVDETPTSDELPVDQQDISNQRNDQSTDSLLKDSDITTETTSLSLSSSPPPLLLGITSGVSSKSFSTVYKTPVKNVQNPCKENSQSDTLNTPTRDKNTSFSESFTPTKQSESDYAKSKRKRFPPEKRFVDIAVPGPSQVRCESGNSQDSCHLKDPIPTFVEKVITETSLPEVLAKTINRKLYGEAKSENTARSSDNKNVEEGQKVECDKLMDEIMLTDFHMTKSDIDEVIHQTSSAGIPVLDDLLKLFASVSEEKDTLSDDECTEPVYDSVEFEGLDSCSQSAQNKEIKLVTSEDDLSKSDLKANQNTCELSSLNKPPTTFLQVVDKLCSSEASTETSSNQASEDLSLKSFSTTQDQEQTPENPTPKMLLCSEPFVKNLQTSENRNSSDNSKQDQIGSETKDSTRVKHPSSCSRRTKVFSKGKSRKLIATTVSKSPNKNPPSIPPNSPVSLSSFTPISSPSTNVMPSDAHSHTSQSITTSLACDTHSNINTLASESTNQIASTSYDIIIPISPNIDHSINTTLSNTSSTNLESGSARNTLTITETNSVTISSDVPLEYTPITTSASLSHTLTTTKTTTTATATTPVPSLLQENTNSSLLVQQPILSTQSQQPKKIALASISESSSVITQVIQPEIQASQPKYPVMYIIAPPPNMPLQLQPTQTSTIEAVSNFACTSIQWPWTADKTTLTLQDSTSLQTVCEESAVQLNFQKKNGKPKRPRGRPKKDPKMQKPTQPKLYNIAPNRDLNTLYYTCDLVNIDSLFQLKEKVTLAGSTDNSWTIEMVPGTKMIILNLMKPHLHQLVSYELTSEQVKDQLATYIGTSAVTSHVLNCMDKLAMPKTGNKPNILSSKRTHKNKTSAPKITTENSGENRCETQASGHQNNSCLTGNSETKQFHTGTQNDEEPILYIATSLGKKEDFLKKLHMETKESPKQMTSPPPPPPPRSQVIDITDCHSSPVIENPSLNLHSSLSKQETFAEEHIQNSTDCIDDQPLNFSKGVSASSLCDSDNNPRTINPLIKDNEYLAINILSTLCYSQSKCHTNNDSGGDASQPTETTEGQSFYELSAASPAKCYEILMEGEKEGQAYAKLVDTPDKSGSDLQEHYGDKPSDLSDIIGYVSPKLCNTRRKTKMKNTSPYFIQEDKTLVISEKAETGHKKVTKGNTGKKSSNKSPRLKTKNPVKRKLYDAFEDKEISGQKNVNKINRTDIDFLLTKLHPDSLDGFNGNT